MSLLARVLVSALLLGSALGREYASWSPWEPLPAPPGGRLCFFLVAPQGYLGGEGWVEDYGEASPLCLKAGYVPQDVTVRTGEVAFRFSLLPDYATPLEGEPPVYLLVYGPPGEGRALGGGAPQVSLTPLPHHLSFGAGVGVATVPGVLLQVTSRGSGWLLFSLEGPALRFLRLRGVYLYKDGALREASSHYMETLREGVASYKGGVRLPEEKGSYQLRFYLAPQGADGEVLVVHSFTVR